MNTTYVWRPCAATSASLLLLTTSLTACSDSSSDVETTPDSTSTGGAPTGSGGAIEEGTGGAQAMTGGTGTGGAPASGGSIASGGAPASGGTDGSGGTPASGGTDGSGGTGGMEATGGASNGDCDPGTILCDGFESYAVGMAPDGDWTATTRGGGAIEVDGERAFSGDNSIHVTGTLNSDAAYIIAPIEDEEVAHVRFMMYTASYPSSSGVHTRLALLGTEDLASGSPYTSYSLATYNGIAIERTNSWYLRDTGTKPDSDNLKNRWVCWEWGVDKTGGDGNVEVYIKVDGNELPLSPAGSSHGNTSSSWDPLVFERFMIGLYGYQADDQPADYWIDDLVVSPEPVGCPDTE